MVFVGFSWEPPGGISGFFWPVSGLSGAVLAPFWAVFKPSGVPLGPSWAISGAHRAALDAANTQKAEMLNIYI
eukprot:3635872-Pyramimonas_sp.AAC.1